MAEQFHFDPDTYLDMVRAEVPDYEHLQQVVADATDDVVAEAILDLGTGTGETLRRVAARHPTARLIGIDESDRMLAVARGVVPGADLRVARLQDDLPEGPFDLVVSALAVHHLDAPEKAALFGRVAALLAPGGRFVLADVIVPADPDRRGDSARRGLRHAQPGRRTVAVAARRQLECHAPMAATRSRRPRRRPHRDLTRRADQVLVWGSSD